MVMQEFECLTNLPGEDAKEGEISQLLLRQRFQEIVEVTAIAELLYQEEMY